LERNVACHCRFLISKEQRSPSLTHSYLSLSLTTWEIQYISSVFQLSMTFELYFDLTWNESRFVINETSPDWGPDGSFMGSTNFIKSLWLPDIQIINLKQFQKRQIVTDVAGLIIFKTRSILYTVSTEAVISCPMKFSAYPLDHQVRIYLSIIKIFVYFSIKFSWIWFNQRNLISKQTFKFSSTCWMNQSTIEVINSLHSESLQMKVLHNLKQQILIWETIYLLFAGKENQIYYSNSKKNF